MKTVLIVDDSNVVQVMIESFITPLGVTIVGNASNGEEALKLFEELAPDIVTLDITMPMMDGLTCLKLIKEKKPEAKVLVISALTDRETGIQALKLGAAGFIAKPFTREQLHKEFTRLLGE